MRNVPKPAGADHFQATVRSIWRLLFHSYSVREDEDLKAIARYSIASPGRSWIKIDDYPHWDAVWLVWL